MLVILRLHADMYPGLPGKRFIGAMGFLFMVAIVSGVVLYWPFTRRLKFGTVRNKSRRIAWLDWHNLLGVVTIGCGAGGRRHRCHQRAMPKSCSASGQRNELAAMAAPYAGKPTPAQLASLDTRVVGNAMKTTPGMDPAFIAFPGTPFTARIISPCFCAATRRDVAAGETGAAGWRDRRSVRCPRAAGLSEAVLVSQPLHFGDYGGMPLKIIWALLTSSPSSCSAAGSICGSSNAASTAATPSRGNLYCSRPNDRST